MSQKNRTTLTSTSASASVTASATASASKSPRIVIIGAGVSGIAAATRLLEAGFTNILILEAEDRIGGRINTVPFGDNVIDLGAQWCHGEKNNSVFEMVKDLNVLEDTGTIYDDFECIRSNRDVLTKQLSDELKTIALNSMSDHREDLVNYEGSLGTYFTEKFWKIVEKNPEIDRILAREFFEVFKKFESSIEAADHLFEVSGKGYLEYWLCDGCILLNWRDKGYRTFLNLLMKSRSKLSEDFGILNGRILLNKRIEKIQWRSNTNSRVVLKCFNGEVIIADHVICTVSLGVLKENYEKMFSPALPSAKCRAIEGLKLGTVDKFFLEFEHPFGPSEWTGFGLLWLEKDLEELRKSKYFWLESVFGFYRVSYQPRLLQGWTIGAHARYMETLDESEVLEGLLWLLRKFMKFPIPSPIAFRRTQWFTNPNFRGSYTFRSMYTNELRTGSWDLAEPLVNENGKPILQFAGEATHQHYYSTVHGAVDSGWREAQRLISYYQGRPSQL